jgi:hypothetical protein
MRLVLTLLLGIAGIFTVALGTAHIFFPRLLDFEHAIPRTGPALKPFRLGPIRHPTSRQDVHGIAWVMNHAASYVLISIGVFDLFAVRWLGTPAGRLLALWIAGWWAIRAGSQLYLGRRRGDLRVLAGFLSLAVLHLLGALP